MGTNKTNENPDDFLQDILENLEFERNVWAEKQLCKLCPNNNIEQLEAALQIEDTAKQMELMQDIIIILHDGYEFKQKIIHQRRGEEYQPFEITKKILDCFNEDEMIALVTRALDTFGKDGEVTVEAKPKKNVSQQKKSTLINPGISILAEG